jgi:hypothetical protein
MPQSMKKILVALAFLIFPVSVKSWGNFVHFGAHHSVPTAGEDSMEQIRRGF